LAAAPGTATLLRASGFAANTLGWAPQIPGGGTCCAGSTPTPAARSCTRPTSPPVAVRCLLGDVPAGGRHHVTGPQQLSQVEQLAAIGAALGRPLRFEALRPDDAVRELSDEFPPGLAEAIVAGSGARSSRRRRP
jgi:uncharacterized protein YbjT (DUF2867 family)